MSFITGGIDQEDGSVFTKYRNIADENNKPYIFKESQDAVRITNGGVINIIVTVGATPTTIKPGNAAQFQNVALFNVSSAGEASFYVESWVTNGVSDPTAASRVKALALDPAGRKWTNALSAAQREERQLSIVCALDSLTATESYLDSFRAMIQTALGNGGIGYVAFNNTMMTKETMSYGTGGGSEKTNANFNPAADDPSTFAPSLYYLQYTSAAGLSMDLTDKNHIFTDAKVFYLKQPGGGTFNWRDGATTAGPIAVNTADTIKSLGIAARAGWPAQKNNLVRASSITGNVILYGADLRNGSSGAVVHRVAQGGTKANQVANLDVSAYTAVIESLGCDLYILNAGMNDPNDTATVYEANIRHILDRVVAANPNAAILLLLMNETDAPSKNVVLETYRNSLQAVADTYGAMIWDERNVLGSYDQAVAAGLMQDGTHPNDIADPLRGAAIFNFLGGAALADIRKALTS